MSMPITVSIVPGVSETGLLMMQGPHEVLKARLPRSYNCHPDAMRMLLQGLSLWYQQQLRVVLSADGDSVSQELGLSDGFGFGDTTLYYEVVVLTPLRRNGRRIRGLGRFHDARRCLRLAEYQ